MADFEESGSGAKRKTNVSTLRAVSTFKNDKHQGTKLNHVKQTNPKTGGHSDRRISMPQIYYHPSNSRKEGRLWESETGTRATKIAPSSRSAKGKPVTYSTDVPPNDTKELGSGAKRKTNVSTMRAVSTFKNDKHEGTKLKHVQDVKQTNQKTGGHSDRRISMPQIYYDPSISRKEGRLWESETGTKATKIAPSSRSAKGKPVTTVVKTPSGFCENHTKYGSHSVKKEKSRVISFTENDIKSLQDIFKDMCEQGFVKTVVKPQVELNKFFREEVQLRLKNMHVANDSINLFKEYVLKEMNEDHADSLQWEYFNDGSYYDGTKVGAADEADCLLLPKVNGVEAVREGAPPGFCFIRVHKTSKLRGLDIFDGEGDYVSSVKYRNFVFGRLDEIMKTPRCRHWKRNPTYDGSPSYDVKFTGIPSSSGMKDIDMDLVPALAVHDWPKAANQLEFLDSEKAEQIKQKGFYVIAKDCTKDKDNKHLLWRMSFCRAEKELTKFADRRTDDDEEKTCRKFVLRVIKRIMEATKRAEPNSLSENTVMKTLQLAANCIREKDRRFGGEFEIKVFGTFHLRTLMWTLYYEVYPGSQFWTSDSKPERLEMTLRKLQKWLTGEMIVAHFFLPGVDIMYYVPKNERQYLYLITKVALEIFCSTKQPTR